MAQPRTSHTHYDIEDTPNTDNPQTALDLYTASRAQLAQHHQQAIQNMQAAHGDLAQIHAHGIEQGNDALAQAANTLWQRFADMYKTLEFFTQADRNGEIIVTTLQKQMQTIEAEFDDLMDAIKKKRTWDSRLSPLVDAIREEMEENDVNYWGEFFAERDEEELGFLILSRFEQGVLERGAVRAILDGWNEMVFQMNATYTTWERFDELILSLLNDFLAEEGEPAVGTEVLRERE